MNLQTSIGRAALCVVVLGLPATSAAQTAAPAELSAGWRLLHATDVAEQFDETLPAGW